MCWFIQALFARVLLYWGHLDGDEVQDGGNGALPAGLAVCSQQLQVLLRPELDLDVDGVLRVVVQPSLLVHRLVQKGILQTNIHNRGTIILSTLTSFLFLKRACI